jgi:hypothetical protein
MKGTEYFVSLLTSVVLTEECNVMVISEGLTGFYCVLKPVRKLVMFKLKDYGVTYFME